MVRRNRRFSFTVLVVVVILFVLRIPSVACHIFGFPLRLDMHWYGSYAQEYAAFEYFTIIADFCLVLNSTTRFFDYLLFRRNDSSSGNAVTLPPENIPNKSFHTVFL